MRLLILIMSAIIFWNYPLFSYTLECPKGWDKIDEPSQLPGKVKVVYIAPGKGQFTPSINLAVEESKLSLEEYIEEAKAYHEKIAESKVTRLGKMMTNGGEAELLQIDRPTSWGDVRFIQAILKVGNLAYVITATSLQEEFGQLSRPIFQTIKSFKSDAKKDCSMGTR